MSTRPRIAAPLLAALFALGFAGCGDGGTDFSADSDPEDVLEAALGGGESISSGDLDLEIDLESSAAEFGAVSASVKGPFVANDDGELPDLDFDISADADIDGPTLGFAGGLTLTGDGLWINYEGQDYQLDDAAFARIQDSYAKSSQLQEVEGDDGGSLAQFGVDPQDWLTDVTNEGTTEIDGTETVHVSGSGDIAKMVTDLEAVARENGQQEIGDAGLGELEDAVKGADIDVYATADDGTLRRLDVAIEIADRSGGGTSTLTASIGIADPNSEQEITAPESALPLSELLGQLSGAVDSLGVAPPAGGGGGGTSAYFECVQQAPSSDAVADCSRLVE